jgi:hypothetical protein
VLVKRCVTLENHGLNPVSTAAAGKMMSSASRLRSETLGGGSGKDLKEVEALPSASMALRKRDACDNWPMPGSSNGGGVQRINNIYYITEFI